MSDAFGHVELGGFGANGRQGSPSHLLLDSNRLADDVHTRA